MVLNLPHQRVFCTREIENAKTVVLDKRTDKMLQELASYVGGNRSLVVREAIKLYSNMEDRLERIEADPAFPEDDGGVRPCNPGRPCPHP